MLLVETDMFGVDPGSGSPLDVLVPEGARGVPEPGPTTDDALAAWAAAHARESAADETVLVTACSRAGQRFTPRVFGAGGETPFVTHSMAGAAAALVSAGMLAPGPVTVDGPDAARTLWTDGRTVRVPLRGPAVTGPAPEAEGLVRGARAHRAGVGRGFLFVDVDDDPLACRAPDTDRMDALGLTDLTLVRRHPGDPTVRARVFAPGFGMPEDAGCLPVAAALTLLALLSDPRPGPVTVHQVGRRGSRSTLTGTGTLRDGVADVLVAGRVRVGAPVPAPEPARSAATHRPLER